MARKFLKSTILIILFFSSFLTAALSTAATTEQISITADTHLYTVEAFPSDLVEANEQFAALSTEQKQLFEQSRRFYLSRIAQILENKNLIFGSFVKSGLFIGKIKKIFERSQDIPEGELGIIVKRLMDEEKERLEKEASESEKKNLRELGIESIQKMLTAINRTMFKQARLMSTSDEFGVSIGVGIGTHIGRDDKVIGGLGKLMFNFGFNRQKKVAVFELDLVLERTKRAITPLLLALVDVRGGLYIKDSSIRSVQRGSSIVTPAVPTTASTYPSHFDAAIYLGLGFPPIINDFMGYLSQSMRFPVIRIEIGLEPSFNFKISFGSTKARFRCEALFAR